MIRKCYYWLIILNKFWRDFLYETFNLLSDVGKVELISTFLRRSYSFNLKMEEYYCKQWSNKANSILLLSLLLLRIKRKKKRPKRFWQRNIYKRRASQGAYHNLLQEMRLRDQEKYFNYLRMSCDTFNELLNIIGPKLKRIYLTREPISPSERLALTLRYLASGDSMVSMSYAFRIGTSTVSHIIRETCNCIWDSLNQIVLKQASEKMWLSVAKEFDERWQLPHCVGAIDGKHVVIQAPSKCGSSFFNYKGSHSIVLLAVCNANYQFTMVDIGGEGRHSDGGIYRNSAIGTLMLRGGLHLPPSAPLDDYGDPINYYIVADEAFPLSTTMMRPYPGRFLPQNERIFNYRLSRGRRMIENVFGVLASRWRIYRKPIIASLPTVEAIVKATVCLHNWVMIFESKTTDDNKRYCSLALVDREDRNGAVINGEWRNEAENRCNLIPIHKASSNMYGKEAKIMRERLTSYFMFEGAVPFQWNK